MKKYALIPIAIFLLLLAYAVVVKVRPASVVKVSDDTSTSYAEVQDPIEDFTLQVPSTEPLASFQPLETPPMPSISPIAREVTAVIKTSAGDITVKLDGAKAPLTVGNFVQLSQAGFYTGTTFHRIIPDFMIQGGDPLSKDSSARMMHGTGGPGYAFPDEPNDRKLVRGSLAMANSGPNTNGSQFFIVTKESTPWLDGLHTNFGEVVEGMDVVDKISAVKVDASDNPVEPVVVEGITISE